MTAFSQTRGPGVWLIGAAAVIVIAAIVGGLFAVGGPGEARLQKLDTARLDDLRTIERGLDMVWQRTGHFPDTLDSLDLFSERALSDPKTGEPYAYQVLSDSTAEVCATFARASDTDENLYSQSDIGAHPAGRHCFTLYPPRPR